MQARWTLTGLGVGLVLIPALALAQESQALRGDYAIVGANDQTIGAAEVRPVEGGLRLTLSTTQKVLGTYHGRLSHLPGEWLFSTASSSGSSGMACSVQGVPCSHSQPVPSVTIRIRAQDDVTFRVRIEKPERTVAFLLRRERGVLLVPVGGEDEDYAQRVISRDLQPSYRARGYTRIDVVDPPPTSIGAFLAALRRVDSPYDRVVIVGHGGWHGPLFGPPQEVRTSGLRQASGVANQTTFRRVANALADATIPNARIFVSACHAGGSNAEERRKPRNKTYVYVDDLARMSGRIVAGPAGRIGLDLTLSLVEAALEGRGAVPKETRWASPEGAWTIQEGETLARTGLPPSFDISVSLPLLNVRRSIWGPIIGQVEDKPTLRGEAEWADWYQIRWQGAPAWIAGGRYSQRN